MSQNFCSCSFIFRSELVHRNFLTIHNVCAKCVKLTKSKVECKKKLGSKIEIVVPENRQLNSGEKEKKIRYKCAEVASPKPRK